MGNIAHILTNEQAKREELEESEEPISSCLTTVTKLFRLHRDKEERNEEDLEVIINPVEQKINSSSFSFSYEILASATKRFWHDNLIGEGGFGSVYKGKLEDGREIAVKKSRSTEGNWQFENEVNLLPRLQHRNVVNFLGCCTDDADKLLVYQYLPNGSLDHIIFNRMKRNKLDWKRRYDVIVGLARGLLYLQEDCPFGRIIHRDIKPSNILLDDKWVPKIADFGLAYSLPEDRTDFWTDDIFGTSGYMSPEYSNQGILSEKTDIFSFGVVMLEMISGKKSVEFYTNSERKSTLRRWIWELYKKRRILDIMDPGLEPDATELIAKLVQIGLLCTEMYPHQRPTILDVVMMLSGKVHTLPQPSSSEDTSSYIIDTVLATGFF